MEAKQRFREGWIMLLRPFVFAELKQPVQKMTILYAYSDEPLFELELNEKGKEEMDKYYHYYNTSNPMDFHPIYSKQFQEKEDDYEYRMGKVYDNILKDDSCYQKIYKGQTVQSYIEGQLCRFFPDEYVIISRETFEAVINSPLEEYTIEYLTPSVFKRKDIKDKVFYLMSRGINKEMSQKLCSSSLKDSVIFRPQRQMLQMFCREHEIIK